MIMVCPLANIWHEIYQRLHKKWVEDGANGEKPPVPLILGGWWYSNDLQKKERWAETIAWADRNGYSSIIPEIRSEDFYWVNLSDFEVEPVGGPTYQRCSCETQQRFSKNELGAILKTLQQKWNEELSDRILANATFPTEFTGKRGRRLLVKVIHPVTPPWGWWDALARGPKRRSFTVFRRQINQIIAPHEVDHIDFVCNCNSDDLLNKIHSRSIT